MFLSQTQFGTYKNATMETSPLSAVTSFAWDSEGCDAWVTSAEGIRKASDSVSTGILADQIVSDVYRNRIYYIRGEKLFELDLHTLSSVESAVPTHGLERVVDTSTSLFFLYQDSERGAYVRAQNKLTFTEFEGFISDEISWNQLKIRTSKNELAIGFTGKSAYSANSPHLLLFNFDLQLLSHTVWPHKGLLLDMRAWENNRWVVSLDKPNSTYTVPVSVYLDFLASGSSPKRFFEGDVNRLMEHIDYSQNEFVLGERSLIRGSYQISLLVEQTKEKVFSSASAILGVRFCGDKKNATSKEVAF